MVKKRGLGKSLDALLSYVNPEKETMIPESNHESNIAMLPLTQLRRGQFQPRKDMDPVLLEELAQSIRAQGVLQPILVRPLSNQSVGEYEIIAGERRFRAAKRAGLTEIPVIIRSLPDEKVMAIALIENIQREDLNPLEEAQAMQRLLTECLLTHQQVAEALGKSRTAVTNLLRLLALPESIQRLVEEKKLEMGHARTLLSLSPSQQMEAAERIIQQHMSVRDAEQLVKTWQTHSVKKSAKKEASPVIQRLEQDISERIKLPVSIKQNRRGKGKLVIFYRNKHELERVLNRFDEEKVTS